MSDNDISKMNDKQLRNEVQSLRDELAIMKRKYEDILYNLDTNNFSKRFVMEQGNMRTAIEVNAKGIQTKVSNEEFQSSMQQTAELISTEVSSLKSEDYFLYSSIAQTAESISTTVSKRIFTKFVSSVHPNDNATITDAQKGMLCEYKGQLYYYNDITDSWKFYSSADGVKSQFVQTASGFALSGDVSIGGDVSISGDAIVGGIITGASLMNSEGTTELELGTDTGNYGDLTLSRYYEDKKSEVFQVYDNLTSINLNALGECFLYSSGQNTYPMGIWNFSKCNVQGLSSATAVFG